MDIYLLQHVSHLARRGPVVHRDEWGDLLVEEDLGDDVKLLGCYSTLQRAEERKSSAQQLEGFREEPDCFIVSKEVLDRDEWTTGFTIVSD
jgi:hypothetical protein